MISMIAAISNNNVIGKDNELPWVIPEDLKHFKEVTIGHPIIMGWNTWKSIGEKPLPGRLNVILSRQNRPLQRSKNIKQIHNFLDVRNFKNPFIIGGSSVYNQYLPITDKLYITKVFLDVYGGYCVKFPNFSSFNISYTSDVYTSSTGIQYMFTEYDRSKIH